MIKNEYLIENDLEGIRLDKAITELDKELSRMAVRKIIRRRKH